MYEQELQDNFLLNRMLDRVSDKLDKRESSPVFDPISATANELCILYIELESLIQNSYGDTAAREFLILLAKDRGLEPEPATHAILKGEFTPTTVDVMGQRFNIGDINYIVTEQIAPGQYQVQCETVGEVGNQFLGDMIPMEYLEGLETASLTEVLIPGEDDEDTEVFRQRYFDSFNEQSFGGNRADYLAKVGGIDGIGDVKLTRVWNGDIRPAEMIPTAAVTAWYNSIIGTVSAEVATWLSAVYMASYEKKLTVGGTVLITVVNSLNYGECSTTLLDSVQSIIDPTENAGEGYGLAPIGHVVKVKSGLPVKVYVTTTITFDEGYGWNNLKTIITEAVDAYLLELRKEWANNTFTVVRVSQIETKILGVKGVVDITNTKINGSTSNLTLGQYEIPVIGGVSA
ncbi:baseplate J/gp47 family protein [Lachnospiraceae bacterium OttesenSCG-928-D06]|nr:baseplate J/gp47 family protein [Lachnospiraceae bacterium OttesenSCG-928-D06]